MKKYVFFIVGLFAIGLSGDAADDALTEELIAAVRADNETEIQRLLGKGADPEAITDSEPDSAKDIALENEKYTICWDLTRPH